MADAKGIYFGGGNTGFATILPRETKGGPFDSAMELGLAKAAKDKAKALADEKKKADAAAQIKNFESWRFYTPAIQDKYKEIISYASKDDFDPVVLQGMVSDVASLSQSSMQMQEEYKGASGMYKADKRVVGAEDWYINKYHSSPTVDNLRQRQSEPADPLGFLNEQGGSSYINPTEAFKTALDTVAKDWIVKKGDTPAVRARFGNAINAFTKEEFEAKYKSFAQIDPKTGKVSVQGLDGLINNGFVDAFMADPFTARLLEDKATLIAGDKAPTQEDYAQALQDYLRPIASQGEYSKQKQTQYTSDYVDLSLARSDREAADAASWLFKKFKAVGEGEGLTGKPIGPEGDKSGQQLPKVFDDFLMGYKDEGGNILGRVQDFNNRSYITVTEPVVAQDGEVTYKENIRPLDMDLIRRFVPTPVANKFEKIARDEGRIDENGNFVFKRGAFVPGGMKKNGPFIPGKK